MLGATISTVGQAGARAQLSGQILSRLRQDWRGALSGVMRRPDGAKPSAALAVAAAPRLVTLGLSTEATARAAPLPNALPLPRSAVAAYPEDVAPLLRSMRDAFRLLTQNGLYRPEELPRALTLAAEVDRYLSAVRDGGHAGFIREAQRAGALDMSSRNVIRGLRAMRAEPYEIIARSMRKWIADHLVAVGKGIEADAQLDRLDAVFKRLDVVAPLDKVLARFLATNPDLVILGDVQWHARIELLCAANPAGGLRMDQQRYDGIAALCCDGLTLGVLLACQAALPGSPVTGVGQAVWQEIAGCRRVTYPVQTGTSGTCVAVVLEDGFALYRAGEGDVAPRADGYLGFVRSEAVADLQARIERLDVAVALHVLSETADCAVVPSLAAISLNWGQGQGDEGLRLLLSDGRAQFDLTVEARGATLTRQGAAGGFYLPRAEMEVAAARLRQP